MIPFLLALAMLGGAVWSFVAALMKQLFEMDEYITTLMLNMIADFFTYWAISGPFSRALKKIQFLPQLSGRRVTNQFI